MSHNYAIYLINQEINRIDNDLIKAFMEDERFMLKNLQRGKEMLMKSVKVLEATALEIDTKKAD